MRCLSPSVLPLLRGAALAALGLASGCQRPSAAGEPARFTVAATAQPATESLRYNRLLVWQPADSSLAELNPPRFCWPHEPTILPEAGLPAGHLPPRRYAFQIARNRQFTDLLLDVPETPYNFYNAIGPLPEGERLFWRVGYFHPERGALEWQRTRDFTIRYGVRKWDRAGLAAPHFRYCGHPRIIFTPDNLQALRKLHKTDPHSRLIRDHALELAEADLSASWFVDFPRSDSIPENRLRERYPDLPRSLDPDGGGDSYMLIFDRLANMAFAWMLTGDRRFLPVKDRFLALAEIPRGGPTSPSGAGGSEDYGPVIEYLALAYDWLHHEYSPAERERLLAGLAWRVEHIVNSYSWRSEGGRRVSPHSIAVAGSSHPFENLNTCYPAGLAAYEAGGAFRTAYELGAHYLSGVNSPFGQDAWNEGPGYGLSKFKWMMYAVSYFDLTLAGAHFGLNPFLTEIGEFFTRVAVLGMPHLSFGNIGQMEPYYLNNRVSSFRQLAYLTGERRFLTSWEDALRRLEAIGYPTHRQFSRPWIEYALPQCYPEPSRDEPQPRARLFPDGGWVSASNLYPGKLDHWPDNLGMVFHARPRGGFNHSFYGDNSFQLYGFGENLTHAGGSTMNGDRHAHHSMAQNLVLVDGLGQAQPSHIRAESFRKELFPPWFARVARFGEQAGTVYLKGEAAGAYVRFPQRYFEFWGRLGDETHNPYDERDVSYLERADRHLLFVDGRYFVMLDELAVSRQRRPEGSRFSWLYHVLQDVPLSWDQSSQSFRYRVGAANVLVQLASSLPFEFEDRQKEQGLVNPLTGEDYRPWAKPVTRYDNRRSGPYPETVTHNLWVTNREPSHAVRYLAVIYPWLEGSPAPEIEVLDELTVRVRAGDRTDLVSFDPAAHPEATVAVELEP